MSPKLSKASLLVPNLSRAALQRLIDLRRQIRIAQAEIKDITGRAELVKRQQSVCLRCDYHWYPNNPYVPPVSCPRCGSTAWNMPPTEQSRKPDDPPAPSWRYPKGVRKPKLRIRVPRAPWEDSSIFPSAITIPPPPSTGFAMTTPPPAPPMFTRFEGEPQPEVQSSHVTEVGHLTVEEFMELPTDGVPVEILEDGSIVETVTNVDEAPEISDTVTVVGQPATDAEREELEKARVEAWPTTRPDD